MEEAAAAEIGQAVEDDVKHARFHDRMKQRSLYVDIQGSRFTTPGESISPERARTLVLVAAEHKARAWIH
jgi:AbiV family abortive infection protein